MLGPFVLLGYTTTTAFKETIAPTRAVDRPIGEPGRWQQTSGRSHDTVFDRNFIVLEFASILAGPITTMGFAELAEDPQFATGQQHVERREDLLLKIRRRTKKIESDILTVKLDEAKIPYGFVNDMAEVFEQPGAKRLLLTGESDNRPISGVRTVAFDGDAAEFVNPSSPPHLHQNADETLQQLLGYEANQIEQLRTSGTFGTTT